MTTATTEDDYHVPGDIQMKRGKIPIFSPENLSRRDQLKCRNAQNSGCSVLYSCWVTNTSALEDVKNSQA